MFSTAATQVFTSCLAERIHSNPLTSIKVFHFSDGHHVHKYQRHVLKLKTKTEMWIDSPIYQRNVAADSNQEGLKPNTCPAVVPLSKTFFSQQLHDLT